MIRPVVLMTHALGTGALVPLSASRLVGDFVLHNSGEEGTVFVTADAGATGLALAPGASLSLDGVDLSTLSAKAQSDMRVQEWKERFAGGSTVSLASGMQSVGSGIGAALSFVESTSTYGLDRIGLAQLSTGTSSTGRRALCLNSSNIPVLYLGQGEVSYEEDIYVPTLSDGTDTYTIVFGLADDVTTAAPANAVIMTYTHGVLGGNFGFDTFDNSSPSVGPYDTGVALAAGAWTTLKVAVSADGTLASFFVNGVLVGTRNSSIPVASGRAVAPILNIVKSAGTNARTLVTDTATFRAWRAASEGATLSVAGVFGWRSREGR